MTTIASIDSQTDPMLDKLAQRGEELYEARLKPLLEPMENGKIVAIHLDNGSYTVDVSTTAARRALRADYPTGMIWTRMIGPETRRSLVRRILGARSLAQSDTAS